MASTTPRPWSTDAPNNNNMMLTDLASILRTADLDVVEVDGWQTRGHDGMKSVKGILIHHTAGPATGDFPSLNVVRDGRPDLVGPLAQLGLGRTEDGMLLQPDVVIMPVALLMIHYMEIIMQLVSKPKILVFQPMKLDIHIGLKYNGKIMFVVSKLFKQFIKYLLNVFWDIRKLQFL